MYATARDTRRDFVVDSSHLQAPPRFHVVKLLGQGTFGRVYLMRDIYSGRLKAVKRTQKWRRVASREVLCLENTRRSAALLAADSVFYTITPAGFTVQNIVMNFTASCSLQTLLTKYRKVRSTNNNSSSSSSSSSSSIPSLRSIVRQIIQGVYELHAQGILHRDLKPENILIDKTEGSDIQARIGDMGSSKRILQEGEQSMPYICSRWYRAPELLLGSTVYSTAVDLWSLGCLLAELLSLRPLFESDYHLNQYSCSSSSSSNSSSSSSERTNSSSNSSSTNNNKNNNSNNDSNNNNNNNSSSSSSSSSSNDEGCAAEGFQLLTIVEVLGSPTEREMTHLCSGCQPSTKVLSKKILLNLFGIEGAQISSLLSPFCPPSDVGLLDIISKLLRWSPHDRAATSTLLLHPYLNI